MKLVDMPRTVPLSLYEETRLVIMEKYAGIPGVLGLLEFGTIPHPGISDMDFFVVTEPHARVSLPHFSTYTEEQRFAMVHRHFVISAHTFPLLNYEDPWFVQVQTLLDSQKRFRFQKQQFDEKGYAALSLNFLYQKLVYGCLPLLADILALQEIPCRGFFEEIKLFQYFLREWKKLSIPYGKEDPAIPFYSDLATRWFSLTEAQQKQEMQKAVGLYAESIAQTAHVLYERLHTVPECSLPRALPPHSPMQRALLARFPRSFIVDTGERVFVYQQGVRGIRLEEEVFHCPVPHIAVRRRVTVLPWCFACFPATHLFLNGCISRHYQECACTDMPVVPLWEDPHLITLYTLASNNVWETRNVTNGKNYEIIYGYRPPPAAARSPWQQAQKIVRTMRGYAVRTASRSRISSLFQKKPRQNLWEVSFPSSLHAHSSH